MIEGGRGKGLKGEGVGIRTGHNDAHGSKCPHKPTLCNIMKEFLGTCLWCLWIPA